MCIDAAKIKGLWTKTGSEIANVLTFIPSLKQRYKYDVWKNIFRLLFVLTESDPLFPKHNK